jgi:spore coat protein U-like protein
MMKKTIPNSNRRRLLVPVFLLAPVVWAYAGGQVEFAETPEDLSANYTYDTQLAVTENVVVRQDSLFATYDFGITAGTSGSYDPRRALNGSIPLDYQIYDDSTNMNIIYDVPDAPSVDNYLSGFLSGNVTVPFDVVVPQGQLVEPGVYQDSVLLRLYQNGNLQDEAPWLVGFFVQGFISVSVVPVGGTFDPNSNSIQVDFGTLEESETREVSVLVLANLPYEISVTSQNDGKLAIQSPPSVTSLVPYTLRVDGDVVNLPVGGPVAFGTGPTPLSGTQHSFEFTIGSTDDAASGVHQDSVTVTVTAQ